MLSQISEAPEVDELSRGALLAEFERIRKIAFRPLSTLGPREFAESVMRGPGEHGSTQDFKFFPYQVEPYEEIFNPRNQEVVLQWFSRGGKSRLILTALGYVIMERPCPIGVMWPVEGDARLWSKDEFMSGLVDPNPPLYAVVKNAFGQRKSSQTMLHKEFPGGWLTAAGSNAPGRLRRMKFRFGYADEIDAIVASESDEGDVLAIFKKRGAEFADTIFVLCSYPSIRGKSRIEAKMLDSDLRQVFVTCIKCGGEPFVMHRTGVNPGWDKFKRSRLVCEYPERPETARLQCPCCEALLTDQDRFAMMLAGKWRATRPFQGRVGFHANSLLWPHPVDPSKFPGGYLQKLAQEEIDAELSDNPEESRRVIVNTSDAETYEGACDIKPSHSVLFNRREKYDPRNMLPAGVLWIGFGADVQDDRLELEFVGFGEKMQTWGLGYHVIKGEKGATAAPPTQGVWADADRLLETTFAHPCGKIMRVSAGLFDRGFRPDQVLAFTRPRLARGIYASRGAVSLSRPIVRPRPTWEGNPKGKVWELGTHVAKEIIYQRLFRDNPTSIGYMHYPEMACYGEPYYRGITVEESEMRMGRDGKPYRFFYCPEGMRNEPFDIRVMALAIERIKKPNYAALALEFAVKEGGVRAIAPPPPESIPHVPQPPRPRSFVHVPRRSGWVTGGRRW